eukprot:1133739-Pelagomonas_calceolata.AAC.2
MEGGLQLGRLLDSFLCFSWSPGVASLEPIYKFQLKWDLTSSQIVWLLGLLGYASHAKSIHDFGNKKTRLGYMGVAAFSHVV